MGLFSSGDSGRLAQLFATGELDEVVWREPIDNLADGAGFVDVVLSSKAPAILQDIRKVGLTYWPDGPVVRGVQNYQVGQSVTFARVPVKKGATLALAASTSWGDSLPARVDVVPAGKGASTEGERRGQGGKGPLDELLSGVGIVVGVVVVLALVALYVKES